ncbi:hypothetical protein LTS18_001004 [Coniosporium uncinatum]|uniref:Uncharacterized protein n=1 Tax=Coniosporium uncinatum TaxID=93489 RepID=A0ACC3D8K7_9PEZI|nr:hypothetical protein LTS18_001004 [Coniosporium uncinatum]
MAAWSKIASMGHVPGNTYDMKKMKSNFFQEFHYLEVDSPSLRQQLFLENPNLRFVVFNDAKDCCVDAANPSITSLPPYLTVNTVLLHSREYVRHVAYLDRHAEARKKKDLEQKAAAPKQTIFHPEHPKPKRVQPPKPNRTVSLAFDYIPLQLSAEVIDHNGKSIHQISSDVKTWLSPAWRPGKSDGNGD